MILSCRGENLNCSGKLDWIATQRNLLAHCKKDKTNPNVLVSSGKEEKIDKNRLNGVLKNIETVSQHLDKLIEKFPT